MENCAVCPFTKYWYIIVAILVVAWAVYKFTQSRNTPPPKEIAGVMSLTEAGFAAAVAEGVTLVDFWATWCGPCQVQLPIIEETVASLPDGVKIAKVNVDEASALAERFGVQSIPTWIVFRDGKEIHRASGLQTKEMLLKLAGTK
mgnify:CR=1 FL=1|jgi:thioredoxin 1